MLFGGGALLLVGPVLSAKVWSSTDWSPGNFVGLQAAYGNLFHPERIAGAGMSGPAFGITVIALWVLAILGTAFFASWWFGRQAAGRRGLAGAADLAGFSPASIVKESKIVLGEHHRDPKRSGICLGIEKWTHRPVWVSVETTLLVLAPPRAGKTLGVVAPAVVDHYGPVVATGVRSDIMTWTQPWRALTGAPMWLCEPMRESGELPPGVQEVRWSPLAGCTTLLEARLRAEALFAALPKAAADDQFWRTAGVAVLAAYLLAAARQDGTIQDVLDWIDRDGDASPVEILKQSADNCTEPLERQSIMSTARQLSAAIDKDPRYKAGVTGQAVQAVDPFRLPAIQRMCNVPIAESFDPDEFLEQSGTIWMLGSVSHQAQSAGVCTALTASIVEAARSRALRERSGRLQPPLLLALDEAVNVAPIPRLDQLLSTGGGSGIQTIVVVQSMAAARNVWGKEMGDALQDFNNVKVVLGGLADAQDLQDISTQLGMRDEMVTQTSRRGAAGLLTVSDYSHSWRQVPVMTPAEVRMIDSKTAHEALIISRASKGIIVRQPRIYERAMPTTNQRVSA